MDLLRRALCAGVASLLVTGTAFASPDKPVIGVVVKIGGIPWFNAMDAGIKKKGAELGVKAFMVGPTSADPALQVRAIEDLIAQKVDVIGVVPNDAEVLEPVLERARAAGIKVITHESPNQKNADYDFELASTKGFGEAYGQPPDPGHGRQGRVCGLRRRPSGSPAQRLGRRRHRLHQGERPRHEAGRATGTAWPRTSTSRASTALDLMRAHPDLKGFLAFGSQGPIGAARAVAERHEDGKIVVMGPFSPGQGRKLVHDGVLTGGFMWNPEVAGEVFVTLGTMVAKGEPIKDGTAIPGLGTVHPVGHNLIVDQLVDLNKDTVDDLAKMGL